MTSRANNQIRSRAMAALLIILLIGALEVTTTPGQTYYYTQPTASYTGTTTVGYYYTTPAQTTQPQYSYQYTYPAQATGYTTYPAYAYANAAPAPTTYQSYYTAPAATTYANYSYAQPASASSGGAAGFLSWLNGVRAQYGLPAVGYDPSLESWAASNNAQQASHGLGHYVMGPARRQNSAVGDVSSIGSMWLNSPAHRAALLDPSITRIGLAGNGQYWTFNAN